MSWRLRAMLVVASITAACSENEPEPEDGDREVEDAGRVSADAGTGKRDASTAARADASKPRPDDTSDGPPVDPDSCATQSAKAEPRLLPVDIVWAIDTSGSMVGSFPAIQRALGQFSSDIEAAGIDAHIVLLSGSGLCVPPPLGSGRCGPGLPGAGLSLGAAADSNLPRFQHLDVSFGYSAGMGVLLDSFAVYKQMLRPDARTHLVLTEDGPPALSPQAVIDHIEGRRAATVTPAWMPGLAPGAWIFSGVVCKNGGFCGGIAPATTLALIEMSGGVLADLAEAGQPGADPFAALLSELAEKTIAGAQISCSFEIPPAPAGQTFDRNKVNVRYELSTDDAQLLPRSAGECGDALAWTYDDEANPTKIVLCEAACALVGQQAKALDVQFGCQTTLLL